MRDNPGQLAPELSREFDNNRSTALYAGQPGSAGTRTLRNINPIYRTRPQILTSTSLQGLRVYL